MRSKALKILILGLAALYKFMHRAGIKIVYSEKASECEDFDDHIYQERAMRLLAEIYRTGEYAEVNEEKANEWLKKADEVKKQSESLKKGTK